MGSGATVVSRSPRFSSTTLSLCFLPQAYVSYKVAARRLDPAAAGAAPPPDVIRRFSDFAWLRAALRAARAGAVVPPLPSKSVVAKYSASAEFIEGRRAALQVFCNRVVSVCG